MRKLALLAVLGAAGIGVALAVFALRPAPSYPPIVVVVVDTLRADHLGSYGYFRPTSPNIDAFAADALLFNNAMTPIGTTLPAHVSLFTGTNPARHGVRGNFAYFHIPVPSDGDLHLAAQIFSRLGYTTAAFVSSPAVGRETGLPAGFDFYGEAETADRLRAAEETTDAALAWLEENGAEPFFLFVHYVDPHSPYAPPAPFDAMFTTDPALRDFLRDRGVARQTPKVLASNNAYDGEIRYTDVHVGRLLDGLRAAGVYDRAAIVFTSDHGEGLGQHGWLYHSRIYNEQMRVPLIVRLPGRGDLRGARADAPISLIDVLPTLAGQLGLPLSERERAQFEGIDVAAGAYREYVFAERVPHHKPDPERGEYFALAGLDWKVFLRPDGSNQLFDMKADPAETTNVIASRPEVAAELLALLQGQLDHYRGGAALKPKPAADIPESARERLRQLGYDDR